MSTPDSTGAKPAGAPAPKPQPQQQGQSAPQTPQQGQPVFKDWASI